MFDALETRYTFTKLVVLGLKPNESLKCHSVLSIIVLFVASEITADAFGPALFNSPVVALKLSISPNQVGVDKNSKSLKSSVNCEKHKVGKSTKNKIMILI